MSISSSAIDLTTLANVQLWLNNQSNTTATPGADPDRLQLCISAASQYIYRVVGRPILYGPVGSPPVNAPIGGIFNGINTYTEVRNGNNSPRMYTLNEPIQSLVSVNVSGSPQFVSQAFNDGGIIVESNLDSIAFSSPMGKGVFPNQVFAAFGVPGTFQKGIGNVQIVYTAGYAEVPFDLEEACRKLVAQNFKRREWTDMKMKAQPEGAGTTTYLAWDMPPEVRAVLNSYKRVNWGL